MRPTGRDESPWVAPWPLPEPHVVFRVAWLCTGGVSPAGVPCPDGPAGRGTLGRGSHSLPHPCPRLAHMPRHPGAPRVLRGRGGAGRGQTSSPSPAAVQGPGTCASSHLRQGRAERRGGEPTWVQTRWSMGCRDSGPRSPRCWVSRTRSPFWHDASAPPRKSSRPQPGGPWGTRWVSSLTVHHLWFQPAGDSLALWLVTPAGRGPPTPCPHLSVHHLHSGAVTHRQHSRVGSEVCPAPGRGVPEHQGLRVLVDLPQPWGDRPAVVGGQAEGEDWAPWPGPSRVLGGPCWGVGFCGRGLTHLRCSTDRRLRSGCR